MVNPVSGFPSSPIPAANTFKPGGSDADVRQRTEEKQAQSSDRTSEIRSERVEQNVESRERYAKVVEESRRDDTSRSSSSSRGTQLDVTV